MNLRRPDFVLALAISITLAVHIFPVPAHGDQNEILIGLIPEENIFKQMKRYKSLARHISDKSGLNVRLTILSKYGDVIDRFVSRKMDGAFFEAFTGALAIEKLNVDPLVRAVKPDGTSTVKSFIFVRSDSDIYEVKDMKERSVAFVDRATATGYVFAVDYFTQNGIKDIDSYFGEIFFTGSYDSAVYAVLDNRADIGTVGSNYFQKAVEKTPGAREELRVIAVSEEMPDITLCVRPGLDEKLKEKLVQVLVSMHEDSQGLQVLEAFGAVRFARAVRGDFKPVFETIGRANIDIKKY